MRPPWVGDFMQIVAKLTTRKDSEYFREPVDWRALDLHDYPVIIKKPMDLNTIKKNVMGGHYQREEDAAEDIRLIFINAMTYNAPGSRVYANAKSLSEYWENCWAGVYRATEDVNRPPNTTEMTNWVEKCHRIPADELGKVMTMLDSSCPNSLIKKSETSEVEVNVDLITGKAFREISTYVDKVMSGELLNSNRRPGVK